MRARHLLGSAARMESTLYRSAALALAMALGGCAVGETLGGAAPDDGALADRPRRDVAALDDREDAPVDDLEDATDDGDAELDADDAPGLDAQAPDDARCTGECVPGFVQSCGRCGVQRCLDDCRWGTCASEGECMASATRTCNGCGTQTCTDTCSWGACSATSGVCTPGATRACGNCGTQTCTAGCAWGACTAQGPCAQGATQQGACDACSQQVCGSNCQWGGCALRAGNACEYRGGRNSRACSACRCGLQWCLPSCQWSTACTSCCSTCGGCL